MARSPRGEALDEAMELIEAACRRMQEAYRALLARRGIGGAHQRILFLIGRSAGPSVSGILERLQITKQALNSPLNLLERKGLVRARRQPDNARRKQLYLTAAGQSLRNELVEVHRGRLAAAFRKIGLRGEHRWREAMRQLARGDRLLGALPPLGSAPPGRGGPARRRRQARP
jgi:DNA-binding MarR family transcriptional regulator